MKIPYAAPVFGSARFNCPHCNAFSNFTWSHACISKPPGFLDIQGFIFCFCLHCQQYSIWHNQIIIYPDYSTATMPTDNMPEDVATDYLEARNIVDRSPRSACALLRLSLQKLMKHLGEKGNNTNDDIASLVKKGLPEELQKALDIIRVCGNNAVHPGEIDLKDDIDTALKLFDYINHIVDLRITKPKEITELWNKKIPDTAKKAIENRDK
ncbi:MAG: hypothetical protein A2539_07285 [Elusimicrobia bacterium RIFOXYD2_FULL_34_15]|nr:MAG: hypothetical protein A2539_07285 [Elusimicrobia bacterium RIFOXYD2_FULL_34_15]